LTLHLHEEALRGLGFQQGVFHQGVILWTIHKATHVHVFGDLPHDSPFQAVVLQSNHHFLQSNHEVILSSLQGVGIPLRKCLP